MPSTWYYARAGNKFGPHSNEEINALAADGKILPNDLVWNEGMSIWTAAAKVDGLLPAPVAAAAPIAPPPMSGRSLNYAGSGVAAPTGPIAAPPMTLVRTPSEVPAKLRHPGMTPVY